MPAISINSPIYVGTPSASSQNIQLSPQDALNTTILFYNGSTQDVYVIESTAVPTAVFPTAANNGAQEGKVIGPGMMTTFTKREQRQYIGFIQLVAGTGNLYICPGQGEN